MQSVIPGIPLTNTERDVAYYLVEKVKTNTLPEQEINNWWDLRIIQKL